MLSGEEVGECETGGSRGFSEIDYALFPNLGNGYRLLCFVIGCFYTLSFMCTLCIVLYVCDIFPMKKRKMSTESFYFRVWSVAIHLPQAPEDITEKEIGTTPPHLMK